MNRTSLIISILVLGAATAGASTFNSTPFLQDPRVDVLTKTVTNTQFGRDLFGEPYASVVIGNVDVYDRFPYLESHYFQVVSDPSWNRLLIGEAGRALAAVDGQGTPFGHLSSPHGMSSDAAGRVYVADTDNDRALVFKTVSEYDNVSLQPLYAIDGLSKPYDVAFSDAGTPFDAHDDVLYVANTGQNEVRRYTLGDKAAQLTGSIGSLGSGVGHFAGPMAITVGRQQGVNTGDVFVSDAHNGRIVVLKDAGGSLAWSGAVKQSLGLITSLDSDHWGNVYATSPQSGKIEKFTPTLMPIASLAGEKNPQSFHVVFANVTDHRTGTETRSGQGTGVLVEQWSGQSGIRLLNLGVEIKDAAAATDGSPVVSMTLTDNAQVTSELVDPHTGQVVARHETGVLAAGPQSVRFNDGDYVAAWSAGDYRVKISAASTYDDGTSSSIDLPIALNGSGGPALPNRLTLLGNTPNPFNPSTTIRFSVPAGPSRSYSLRVYDVAGRLVNELASGQIGAGQHDVRWDGRDARGVPTSSGIYLYQLVVGQEKLTGKMALIK
jgi:FlgD Ig-like domain